MKGKKSVLIMICALVLLIGSASVLYSSLSDAMQNNMLVSEEAEYVEQEEAEFGDEEQQNEKEKMSAPDFTVYDIDGNEIQLSGFVGKPVVLNFWASWCGPCKMEMPDFEGIYEKYGEDINFVMVNLTDGSRETVKKASKFIEEQKYTFPVYYDTEGSATMTYGVRSIPMTLFIDEEGYLIAQGRGVINTELIEQGISMIYKK